MQAAIDSGSSVNKHELYMGYINIDAVVAVIVSELDFEFVRSSGVGGQNVNKVNSKAVMRWNLNASRLVDPVRSLLFAKLGSRLTQDGDLLMTSDESRDQPANKNRCIEKLEALIRESLRVERKRIKTKPTKSSKRKRLDGKRIHKDKKSGRKKIDF